MAVVRFTSTVTLQDVSSNDGTTAVPCRLMAVEVTRQGDVQTAAMIQMFDALASGATAGQPTGGALRIPAYTVSKGRRKQKFIFPGGGLVFGTSLSMGVYTNAYGNTVATTTAIPWDVKFFYSPYEN